MACNAVAYQLTLMTWILSLQQTPYMHTGTERDVPILSVDDSSHSSQQLHGSSL